MKNFHNIHRRMHYIKNIAVLFMRYFKTIVDAHIWKFLSLFNGNVIRTFKDVKRT